ncbi:hypothetical protein JCM10213_003163 [Rhodosporidiobolus nylandii]
MERVYAPYSPVASTSRVPYTPVPSSDFGEAEEAMAATMGEGYWLERARVEDKQTEQMEVDQQAQELASEDEPAWSPIRSEKQPRPSSSLVAGEGQAAPSPSPSLAASGSASPRPLSPLGSPSLRVSSHMSPFLAKTVSPRRSPSPARSDASSGITDIIARPRKAALEAVPSSSPSHRSPTPTLQRSPTPSPRRRSSPRASSPPPDIPPDPEPPLAGRSFRTRTAAQLNPYSIEQVKYTRSLLRNGWEGAVVRGQRAVEETAAELQRKKLAQAKRPKDSLGGWLVDEEQGTQQGELRRTSEGEDEDVHMSEASDDGLTLLEREARRKERMSKAADAALRWKLRAHSPHRKGPSRIDDPRFRPDTSRTTHKADPRPRSRASRPFDSSSDSDARSSAPRHRRHRAESAPPSSSPAHSTGQKRPRSRVPKAASRRPAVGDEENEGRPRKSRKQQARADSEPPVSSPGRSVAAGSSKKSGMARPSKGFHASPKAGERSALDQDILNLPRIESSSSSEADGGRFRSDGESDLPSEAEEDDEEESQSPERLKPSRLELGTKRKRALGAMMPAVFMKKAQADLKLMQKERVAGDYSSGSELNSGDEEALVREKRNRAKRRNNPRLLEEPMHFEGDAFTDESGEDPDRSDDGLDAAQDEEAEDDAVGMWLKSFAPRKGAVGGGGDEDIVDRFLKRAKRPTKPRAKGAKRQAGAGGGTKEKGKNKEMSRKDKQRREARHEDGVYVVGGGGRPPPSASRRRLKAIQLDTDEAVFSFAGLRNEGAPGSDDEVVIVSATAPRAASPVQADRQPSLGFPAPATAASVAVHGETWATFGKFSHDFGISRLASGVQLDSPDSFVKNGHLFSLVDPAGLPSSAFFADTLAFSLSSLAAPDAVSALLPPLCDAIFDSLSPVGGQDEANLPLGEIGAALRFFGHYVSTQLPTSASSERSSLGTSLLAQLDRLGSRLDAVAGSGAAAKTLRRSRILLAWYAVDLAARLQRVCGPELVTSERLLRLATALIRRLVQHRADRTMKSLRAVMESASEASLNVADVTVEAWLGLISLALKASEFGEAAFGQGDLWRIALEETRATLGLAASTALGAGEVLSYTTMMLCAISQFSPSGISTSTPRLQAFWPAAMQTLEAIQPAALAAPDHALSSTAVARRDRYLWTLFARCLVFVERWGWSINGREELLPRLFDLLNARRLSDLTTETRGDIPAFLQNLAEFGDVRLDPSADTAFSIFLKLVIAAARTIPSSTDAEKRRYSAQLTRLFVRLAPMSSSTWSRTSSELTRSPSILVNHYSLHLTFAMLLPSAAAQRVEHARRLLDFANVDEEARKTCIRAILHFGLAFRYGELSLAPVVEWFGEVMSTLSKEYVEVERQRRKEEGRWAKDRSRPTSGDPLWLRAIMITMVLRAVQVALRWKKQGNEDQAYPDTALLHPAWTSQLIQSPLALDPMIGRETIQTLACFLDVRRASLPRPRQVPPPPPVPADDGFGESQDDYGDFDLDFDDPELDKMLGIQPANADEANSQKAREDAVKAKDKAFSELVKTRLGPAFFNLVSKIYLDAPGSGPTITDRAGYAQEAVETWIRCVAIAVENQVVDWRPYLQYGDQSWKRISDPAGRRDVGLFVVVEILKHDPAVYSLFADDILEIWFDSLVARRLTTQHALTNFLLNVDAEHISSVSPLLEGLPFERDPTNAKVEVEQLDLLDKRGEVLQTVFDNAARLVIAAPSASLPTATRLLHGVPSRPTVPRVTVMNLLRSLLSSMRDNLGAIHAEADRKRYASLVKTTLAALTNAGSDGGKKGPFQETVLPDIRILRSMTA